MTRILCIEDEPDFRENICEFLSAQDFEVHAAQDGAEGLNKVQAIRPDLVVCDVQMPHLSGFDVLQKLQEKDKQRYAETPFIFLTAWGEKDHETRGRMMGCEDYLTKPVNFDKLMTSIRSRLIRKQAVQENYVHKRHTFEHFFRDMISVHLMTPLQAVLSYNAMMKGNDVSALQKYKDMMSQVAKQQLDSLSLVHDVLMLQHAPELLHRMPVTISKMLWEASVLALGSVEVAEERIKIHTDIELPVVSLDGSKMLGAFRGLFVDYMKCSSQQLQVRVSQENDRTIIHVSPNEMNQAEEMMQSRYQLWEADADPEVADDFFKFYGLSAMLLKACVMAHGGRVLLKDSGLLAPDICVELASV